MIAIILLLYYNMKQQNHRSISKPIKSLSARVFNRSANKQSNSQLSKRIQTLHTQPLQRQTFTTTKRQIELQSKTARVTFRNWKKQASSVRSREELLEENQRLKVRINGLQQDLQKQKSKCVHYEKELAKLHKQFEVQFEDPKHYQSVKQTNVVQGVKYHYHKTKQKYEEKCRQYETLMKIFQNSQAQEYRIYCETLENDNKKLKTDLAYFIRAQEHLLGQLNEAQFVQKEKIEEVLGVEGSLTMLRKRVEDLEERQVGLREKIGVLKGTLMHKNKKIEHLDRLLTERGNQIRHSAHKQRRMQSQLKAKVQLIRELQGKLQLQQQRHGSRMQALRQKQNSRFQVQKAIFVASLKEKDSEIQRLSQEVSYYSTIFSYLKSGEDPFKMEPANSHKNSAREHSKQFLINIQKSLFSLEAPSLSARKRVKSLLESGLRDLTLPKKDQNAPQMSTEILRDIRIISDAESDGYSQQVEAKEQNQQQQMEQRRPNISNVKRSQFAVRMRHIKPHQVSHLKKELKYRFIFYGLTIDQAKEYLSFELSRELQSTLSQRDRRWRVLYISMAEVKEKLKTKPFELNEEDATLLGRYIVEDATKEELYYQQDNQIERTIAKSIMRAFVGEYSLPNEVECRRELSVVLQKSGSNLRSALRSLAPAGVLSAERLIEICESIQIELSEFLKDWVLSRLLWKSKRLSQLQYVHLFEGL